MKFELNAKTGIKLAVSVLAFILVIVSLHVGLSNADKSMNSRMAESVRRSILDGAVLCYSVEGAYPEDLAYLKENYGIKIDESRYIVHYQYFAANIKPDVLIIEKG